MARFDPDTTFHFKRGRRGEILFFPRGSWGLGHVVPNEACAETIAHRQMVLYRWAGLCTFLTYAVNPLDGWRRFTLNCVALFVTTAVASWRLRRAVMRLPTSDARLHPRDILAQVIAEVRGASWRIQVALILVIVGLLLVIASR